MALHQGQQCAQISEARRIPGRSQIQTGSSRWEDRPEVPEEHLDPQGCTPGKLSRMCCLSYLNSREMPGLGPNSQRKKTKRLPSLLGTEALWDLEIVEGSKRHCMGTSKVLILGPRQLGSGGTKPGSWGSSQSCRVWGGGSGGGAAGLREGKAFACRPKARLCSCQEPLGESHSLQKSLRKGSTGLGRSYCLPLAAECGARRLTSKVEQYR